MNLYNPIFKLPKQGILPLLVLAATKFLIHFTVNLSGAYGYFRDEFYYIACSDRLAFGYVDQPPLSIFLLKISRIFFGDSLTAIRLLPALSGALTVLLAGLIARELGGGRFAQFFAALCVLLAPMHLGINSYFSMNSIDILVWTVIAYIIAIWVKHPSPHKDSRTWIILGMVLGVGLQNKVSVLWLGFGLAVGLLFTRHRRSFLKPGPWMTCGIAFTIFLPHIIWQAVNNWPTLEFMANARSMKMLEVSPLDYLGNQVMGMHPLLSPVWLAGLAWFLFSRKGRPFRILGIIYIAVFALLVTSGTPKPSYLAPAYPMLFAAGGLVLESMTGGTFPFPIMKLLRGAVVILVLAGGIAIAPLALPALPVETYIDYAATLDVGPSTEEKHDVGALGQFFADMHGWEEIVATVDSVYKEARSEEERLDTKGWAIVGTNYGNTGAIEFLGKKRDLPPAISGHNNYWLWGPGDPPPKNLIILGARAEDLGDMCGEAWQADTIDCGYCMPYENNQPVSVCRGLKVDMLEKWPERKRYR